MKECNNTFTPPLSERVLLSEYAKKLYTKAFNIECWFDGNNIIGLISFYINNTQAYITNVSVSPDFQGRGIAKELMSRCINISKEKHLALIILEVNISNVGAITLYEKYGFHQMKINNNTIRMELEL